MVVVVQAYVDGLDVVARQQVVQAGVDIGDAVQPGDPVCLGLVDVSDGDKLNVRHLGVGFYVALADLPDADDADAHAF